MDEVIAKRLKTAVGEMRHWSEYDYVVVNDDLERAYQNVRAILKAERLKQFPLTENRSVDPGHGR